jgi:hypothetical protein
VFHQKTEECLSGTRRDKLPTPTNLHQRLQSRILSVLNCSLKRSSLDSRILSVLNCSLKRSSKDSRESRILSVLNCFLKRSVRTFNAYHDLAAVRPLEQGNLVFRGSSEWVWELLPSCTILEFSVELPKTSTKMLLNGPFAL